MRRLLMSGLIRIFTVCLVNLFFIPIIELWNKQSGCTNLAVCPNIPYFTLDTRQRFRNEAKIRDTTEPVIVDCFLCRNTTLHHWRDLEVSYSMMKPTTVPSLSQLRTTWPGCMRPHTSMMKQNDSTRTFSENILIMWTVSHMCQHMRFLYHII